MGHAVEALALQHGHEVACTIDLGDSWPDRMDADVAVEFTTPQTAVENLLRCLQRHVPVVCGTTGWYSHYDEVCAACHRENGIMLTATNFSIGMNIMFALNEQLASIMNGRPYKAQISETHHIHKLDAPSGTAITLQQQIVEHGGRTAGDIPIESFRIGEIPGTHTVAYVGDADTITLTHEAHNRQGLAQGALLAAEWLAKAAPGVYTMKDIIG